MGVAGHDSEPTTKRTRIVNRFPGSRDRVPRRNTPVASAYLGLIAVSTLYQLWSRRCVLLERLFD